MLACKRAMNRPCLTPLHRSIVRKHHGNGLPCPRPLQKLCRPLEVHCQARHRSLKLRIWCLRPLTHVHRRMSSEPNSFQRQHQLCQQRYHPVHHQLLHQVRPPVLSDPPRKMRSTTKRMPLAQQVMQLFTMGHRLKHRHRQTPLPQQMQCAMVQWSPAPRKPNHRHQLTQHWHSHCQSTLHCHLAMRLW